MPTNPKPSPTQPYPPSPDPGAPPTGPGPDPPQPADDEPENGVTTEHVKKYQREEGGRRGKER